MRQRERPVLCGDQFSPLLAEPGALPSHRRGRSRTLAAAPETATIRPHQMRESITRRGSAVMPARSMPTCLAASVHRHEDSVHVRHRLWGLALFGVAALGVAAAAVVLALLDSRVTAAPGYCTCCRSGPRVTQADTTLRRRGPGSARAAEVAALARVGRATGPGALG